MFIQCPRHLLWLYSELIYRISKPRKFIKLEIRYCIRLDGLRNSINPDIVLFIAGHSSSWKDSLEGHWEQWTLSSIPIQGDFTSFAHLRHFIVQWSPEIYGAYVPKVGWLKHDCFLLCTILLYQTSIQISQITRAI